ncbi:hypothetical protein CP970_20605 [Streptomyces kanamyceticus]|uniref:Uncharacterized protein n=1 Tax=Streptomyces kanamyceticus TaxID=1967 RepID=A0A5J6GGH0_STRKN|nr:hypothetical protein CP970_20605 [Streptomyces kanamyceticus]
MKLQSILITQVCFNLGYTSENKWSPPERSKDQEDWDAAAEGDANVHQYSCLSVAVLSLA